MRFASRSLILCFVCAVIMMAQPNTSTQHQSSDIIMKVKGEVTKVDTKFYYVSIVSSTTGKPVTMVVGSSTVITINGVPATLADLQKAFEVDEMLGI